MKEGFTAVTQPAYHYITCRGCKYLKSSAMRMGHRENTYNYSCTHEAAPKSITGIGGNIATNTSDQPTPPDWCPFRKTTTP